MNIVKVTGVIINSIGSKDVFEKQETIVVFVLHRWSIVIDTNVRVIHLIISDKKKSWNVNWFLCVSSWYTSLAWKGRESLLNLVNNLRVGNITSCNNNDILSIIVGGVIVS